MELQLSSLETGRRGIVIRIAGDIAARRRIIAMGIVRGTKIKVVRKAPLGDPIEFELKDYNLSLRRREAEKIYVDVEEE